MTMVEIDLPQLAVAMNDSAMTYIGSPFRNTHYVRISLGAFEPVAGDIQAELNELGIDYKFTTPTMRHGPLARFSFYTVDSQAMLLRVVGDQLDQDRRERLDVLVRARSPIPEEVREKMRYSVDHYGVEELVRRLNNQRVPDGMGGKQWTVKKVKRALES